jgi:hypothetical protein
MKTFYYLTRVPERQTFSSRFMSRDARISPHNLLTSVVFLCETLRPLW